MAPHNSKVCSSSVSLSIVSTLYCSERHVEEFCRRCVEAVRPLSKSFEIILVNDGSPDSSLDIALQLQEEIPELTVVDLARNFGHHPALIAGLSESQGSLVFLIDSDLEESPEWVGSFHHHLTRGGFDVVFGQQESRKGGLFEGITGELFYTLFNLLSSTCLPRNFVTARLMTRDYVMALLEYKERALFLGGTFVLAGFRQSAHYVVKKSESASTYSLSKRCSLFVNAVTSFSTRPLELVFLLGTVITAIAVVAFSVILVRGFIGNTLIGWASVMASIWLFGGLTIFALGLLGLYLGKVLVEVKQRPLFKIRRIHRRSGTVP
jgi:putative glycosyltransferase